MRRGDTKMNCCRVCGVWFEVSKYSSAKFCHACRKKAYSNTYQPKRRAEPGRNGAKRS